MADYTYRVRKLDDDGDISFSGTTWLYDIEAIEQTIKTRLNLISKEYWRNVSDGTPWFSSILGKVNSQSTVAAKEQIIKERILETFGVLSIASWDSDFDRSGRKISITAQIITEVGSFTLEY